MKEVRAKVVLENALVAQGNLEREAGGSDHQKRRREEVFKHSNTTLLETTA